MENYSVIKRNASESGIMRWMNGQDAATEAIWRAAKEEQEEKAPH